MLTYKVGCKVGSFMSKGLEPEKFPAERGGRTENRLLAAADMLSRNGFVVVSPMAPDEHSAAGKCLHEIRGRRETATLTRTESRLLQTLAVAHGEWCSRHSLIKQVWTSAAPTDSALSVHLFNLRAKFRKCVDERNPIETSRGRIRLDPEALKFLR